MTAVQAARAAQPSDAAPSFTTARSYAFPVGEFGANLCWNMVSGFILVYYTNVAKLPLATVGTLLLVTRILDAFADPAIGILVDKTRSRFGRARPWLLYISIPFAIMVVLTFSVPDWSQNAKLAYAFVTFTIVGLLFAALYVPYNAMVPLLTSDPAMKLRLGSFRSMASSLGSIAIYSSMIPLVTYFGADDQQRGYTIASAIMATGAAAAILFVFKTCPERSHASAAVATEPVRQGVRGMLRNPVWLIATTFGMAMFFRLGSLVTVTAYYAIDVLGNKAAIAILLSSLSFSIFLGGLIARPFLTRFGKRRGNIMALSFAILMALLQQLVRGNDVLYYGLYFVGNITLGIQAATIFTMVADAVDKQQQLFGSRNEGLLSSTVAFGQKVGMAVGGAVVAYGLAFIGYVPDAVTDPMRTGIAALYFGAPVAFAALQLVIISFYKEDRA